MENFVIMQHVVCVRIVYHKGLPYFSMIYDLTSLCLLAVLLRITAIPLFCQSEYIRVEK